MSQYIPILTSFGMFFISLVVTISIVAFFFRQRPRNLVVVIALFFGLAGSGALVYQYGLNFFLESGSVILEQPRIDSVRIAFIFMQFFNLVMLNVVYGMAVEREATSTVIRHNDAPDTTRLHVSERRHRRHSKYNIQTANEVISSLNKHN